MVLLASRLLGEEDQHAKEAEELRGRWYQCVARKGENHPDCRRIQQDLIDLAYRRLERWRDLYRGRCSDSKAAETDYCRNLKRKIKELEKELEDYLGGPQQRSLFEASRLALAVRWAEVASTIPEGTLRLEGHLLLGYAQLELHNWAAAWTHFAAIDASEKAQRESLLAWAEKLCRANPDAGMALLLRGDALARVGRFAEALASLDSATDGKPDLALACDIKGQIWMVSGLVEDDAFDRAVVETERAIRIDPARPHSIFQRAMLDLLAGKFDAAIAGLSNVLASEPAFVQARNARGVAHVLRGDYEEALLDFDRTLEQSPQFASASANKAHTTVMRARGLFAVDLHKHASLSAKGILGAEARTIDMYYAGAGINSPQGGPTLDLATQRAGPSAHVITIRERDYLNQGYTANDPRLATTIRTYVSMETAHAKAEGKNVVISAIPATENYRKELATDYMFGSPVWNRSRDFMGVVMDSSVRGFHDVERGGKAVADVHSQHGDIFAHSKGPCFDQVIVHKGRTGGGLNDAFATRCMDYKEQGKEVFVHTGRGDIPSLGNIATKDTVTRLADQGLVTAIHDSVNHGHGIPMGNSVFDIHSREGTRQVVGSLDKITGSPNATRDLFQPGLAGGRSGVFMKLGSTEMDVTRQETADLGSLFGEKPATPAPGTAHDAEPDLTFPLVIFNPTVADGGEHPRRAAP